MVYLHLKKQKIKILFGSNQGIGIGQAGSQPLLVQFV